MRGLEPQRSCLGLLNSVMDVSETSLQFDTNVSEEFLIFMTKKLKIFYIILKYILIYNIL